MGTVVSVVAACVSTGAAVVSVIFSRRAHARGLVHDMRGEHDELAVNKSPIFWGGAEEAYKCFQGTRPDLPNRIQELAMSAGPPPGLRGIDPIDYLPAGPTPAQKALWTFATLVYPTTTRGDRANLERESIVPDAQAEGFFEARSRYCGFWDKWANHLGPSRVARVFRGQAPLIILLTYLDLTHRQWTGERHKGKRQMYRLAELVKNP